MKAKDKPQIKIRVSTEVKQWLDNKARDEQRSLSFIADEAMKEVMRLEEVQR